MFYSACFFLDVGSPGIISSEAGASGFMSACSGSGVGMKKVVGALILSGDGAGWVICAGADRMMRKGSAVGRLGSDAAGLSVGAEPTRRAAGSTVTVSPSFGLPEMTSAMRKGRF